MLAGVDGLDTSGRGVAIRGFYFRKFHAFHDPWCHRGVVSRKPQLLVVQNGCVKILLVYR